jgi:outer membrane protein assembly factor BamB
MDPTTGAQRWRNKTIRSQCSPVVYQDGYVYGFDKYIDRSPGYLTCVEAATGKEMWRKSDIMGNLIVVDRYMLILTTKGLLVLTKVVPREFIELGNVQVLKGLCWIPPSFANGRIYCRNNQGKLVCHQVNF